MFAVTVGSKIRDCQWNENKSKNRKNQIYGKNYHILSEHCGRSRYFGVAFIVYICSIMISRMWEYVAVFAYAFQCIIFFAMLHIPSTTEAEQQQQNMCWRPNSIWKWLVLYSFQRIWWFKWWTLMMAYSIYMMYACIVVNITHTHIN